jgi:hypothetical protein
MAAKFTALMVCCAWKEKQCVAKAGGTVFFLFFSVFLVVTTAAAVVFDPGFDLRFCFVWHSKQQQKTNKKEKCEQDWTGQSVTLLHPDQWQLQRRCVRIVPVCALLLPD